MTGRELATPTTELSTDSLTFSAIEDRAWIGFARTHFAIDREVDALLHEVAALSLGDFFVLNLLRCDDRRERRLTEIAEQTLFTLSGISRMVNALVERDLVARRTDPSDGRANLIALSDAGEQLLVSITPEIVALIRRRFLNHFSQDELATMAGFWSRIPQ